MKKNRLSPAGRLKIISIHRGSKHTEGHKEKIRLSMLGKRNSLGFKHSEDAKKKIAFAQSGSRCRFWKGGISTYDRKLYLNLQRWARKKGAEGYHSEHEWNELKRECNFTCPCCYRKEPDIVLNQDHIIPLVSGGSDYIDNIQPLCKSCNSKKHCKIINFLI